MPEIDDVISPRNRFLMVFESSKENIIVKQVVIDTKILSYLEAELMAKLSKQFKYW